MSVAIAAQLLFNKKYAYHFTPGRGELQAKIHRNKAMICQKLWINRPPALFWSKSGKNTNKKTFSHGILPGKVLDFYRVGA
ncbi:MAG: hypothetical protein SOZ49_09965 [Clostridiaceae bacterium]|nr:hypothetical protein [Clostridia bacterium]MDY3871531.1 hypothetical protein [Clostridiaceae bacterium]